MSRSLNRDEKRAAVLTNLLAKVEAAGGELRLTAATLAEEFDVPLVTVRSWLARWSKEGAIRTQSAGPHGTVVRAGTAKPVRTGNAAPSRRPAAARAGGASAAGPAVYCVWCGARSKYQGARFCSSCGKELERA